MGMFDSVYVECPVCGKHVEFQSKAGACLCKSYKQDQVPTIIALDLDGDTEFCRNCGEEIIFYAPISNDYVECFGLQYGPSNEDSDND